MSETIIGGEKTYGLEDIAKETAQKWAKGGGRHTPKYI